MMATGGQTTSASETNEMSLEERISHLMSLRELKENELRHCVDERDEAVRRYLDEEGGSATRLSERLGVNRSRIYQYRDRGREKFQEAERRASRRRRARSISVVPDEDPSTSDDS